MFDRYPERVDTPNGAPDAGATGADKTVLSGPFARLRKASDLKQALAAARAASDLDALNAVSWESMPV